MSRHCGRRTVFRLQSPRSWTSTRPLASLYPPAVVGGIVLRLHYTGTGRGTRPRPTVLHVQRPGEAVRWMRRTVRTHAPRMTRGSQLAAARWYEDPDELHAALDQIANRRTYERTWMLRNGYRLTLTVAPRRPRSVVPTVEVGHPIPRPRKADPMPTSSTAPHLPARVTALPPEPPAFLDRIVRRGDWVLQIGACSPAPARLVELSGQTVVSLQQTRAAVEDVRAALGPAGRRAGLVDVEVGNLYDGRPETGPFDVIVVNSALGGLSPRWWDQLAPDGVIVAPIAVGGLHPWLVAGRDPRDGRAYGRVLGVDLPENAPAPAPSPLYAGVRLSPAAMGRLLPMPRFDTRWAAVVPPRLTAEQYADLWLILATRDERITAARVAEAGTAAQAAGSSWRTGCALVAGDRAVHVREDGLWTSDTDPVTHTLAQVLADHVQEWAHQRRPQATALTCRIAQAPDAGPDALHVAAAWSLTRPVLLPR